MTDWSRKMTMEKFCYQDSIVRHCHCYQDSIVIFGAKICTNCWLYGMYEANMLKLSSWQLTA